MRALVPVLSTALLTASVLVASLIGPSSHAQAQSQDTRNRARQLYTEAQALFDAGNFPQAEASFRAAYQAVPNPVVLKAIATAQERQGNISGAIETLQQYLRESPNAPDRAEVEHHIQELAARPATVMVSSTPPGATIVVDGQDTGHTTPSDIEMAAGEHAVELRLTGYSPTSQSFTAQAATRVRLEMNLSAATGGADAFGTEGGDGQGAGGGGGGGGGGSSDPSVGVWVTAGIAAVALISGTVFGFLALSEQSNFDNAPSNEIADRGEAFALVADISFGVAAAMAITAVVLYIVESSNSGSNDSASLDPERVRLSVAPWVDPQSGGVAAQLRF
jgi:tetratricopeptide (TPR) repeat protein